MQVREYMTATPITIDASADYQQAFGLMEQHGMHHLPVTDAGNRVVGIITRRDLQLAARFFHESPAEISEMMHTPVTTIAPDEGLQAAVTRMMDDHIGCLPVSEDGGSHLIGIITETDLLRALGDLLAARG